MLPLPLHLPSLHSVLAILPLSHYLAKTDWRHGFYHLTLSLLSRPDMGIRLPDGTIARYKGASFGPS